MRIDRAVGDFVTLADLVALHNLNAEAEGNQIGSLVAGLLVVDDRVTRVLDFLETHLAVDFADDCEALGTSCLKELLNTRKTLCDILAACDAAGMEGTHGELCTGLADGLSRDDTNSLADRNGHAVRKVSAVALAARAVLGAAGEDGADLDALNAGLNDDVSLAVAHHNVL